MFIKEPRVWLLTVGVLVVITGLASRLAYLQMVRSRYFNVVAVSQRQQAAELAPARGTIYLQERGTEELFPVAVNDRAWIGYAVPREMSDPLQVATELAPAIFEFRQRQRQRNIKIMFETGQATAEEETAVEQQAKENEIAALREELFRKFDKHSDPYEPFLKFYEVMDEKLKTFLDERKLTGIVLEETTNRVYPENSLAAQVLGYVGWQDDIKIGRYGVEGFFDRLLAGDWGFFSMEKDASGQFIGVGSRDFEPAQDGADVILTIDRVVQSVIEDELKDGVKRYGAERGSVIVMDPKTGTVLGMSTYPTYDPNYYYAINEPRVQLNPVVSEIFEPGSVLKPAIMASAIDAGLVTPESTFVDSGPVRVADRTINTYDGKHYGVQTMTQILEKSNNVGMVWVGQKLGAEAMYDYLRRFGLGEKTGIELEGETQSTLAPPDKWNVTTTATTAFGQGVAVTPLQALNAINALANDGVLMQPRIVAGIRPKDGMEEKTQAVQVRQVVSPATASELSAMMVSVIENGVAALAKVPGYYMAGKTGTAQVPDETGHYDPDRKIISFVGFGPVDRPVFSVMIKLDNPAGLSFASGTAAPMFRHIAEKLLNYYQISPDYDAEKKPPKFDVNQVGEGGA